MVIKHITVLSFIGIACLTFSGYCAKKNINPYLRPLTSYIDYQETKHDITLRVKRLSQDDCKPFFQDRAKLLFKKKRRKPPIYPLQFSITNNSEQPIFLKPDAISLELTPYTNVAQRLEHNAFLQIVGGFALAILTTGLLIGGAVFAFASFGISTALFGSLGATISAPLLVAGLSAVVVTPFFVVIGTPIVSTMKGVKSYRKNSVINYALTQKTLHDSLSVEPGHTVDTLLFVSKPKFRSEFDVSFSDLEEGKIVTFHVTLDPENEVR